MRTPPYPLYLSEESDVTDVCICNVYGLIQKFMRWVVHGGWVASYPLGLNQPLTCNW